MNKKGNDLPIKIFFGLILFLTFFAGVNNLFVGLIRKNLIGIILPSFPQATSIAYVIGGLSVLITAGFLAFKIFKKK